MVISYQDEERRAPEAKVPTEIPLAAWKDILRRVWRRKSDQHILLVAAGATFYLLLAMFPALTAFVSIYGLFFDPRSAIGHTSLLEGVLPDGGVEIIRDRLTKLTSGDRRGSLGFGLAVGILFAFWSANNGVKTIFEALNIAYRQKERRSFLKLNLVSMLFTVGTFLAAIVLLATLGVVPAVLSVLKPGIVVETGLTLLRWCTLIALVGLGIGLLYRFGPSRDNTRWEWLSWGSGAATLMWFAASFGFSFYLQNLANYDAVYGSLGAVIAFLVWLWISVVIVLIGAVLNAEMVRQSQEAD